MRARRAGTPARGQEEGRRGGARATVARLRQALRYRALRSAQPAPERSGGTRPNPQFQKNRMEHATQVTIQNKYGLHARPAAEFVKLANRFRSSVWIRKDDVEVSGKSIMGVMMLAAEYGSTVHIRAQGEDAADAVGALAELVQNRFGEG